MMWFGNKISQHLNLDKIRSQKDTKYSHDNLFHTLLGLFEVQTTAYKQELDILHH
jgi:lipid A ethanolaminephosphotransferase